MNSTLLIHTLNPAPSLNNVYALPAGSLDTDIIRFVISLRTAILSWLQNDGSRGFSVDLLNKNNFC